MEAESFTEKVLQYQGTGEGLEELLLFLSPRIYGYPKTRNGWTEDDCGEFFLFFYPRLLRTLQRFNDQGKPFEWYFNSVMRWQYLVYGRVRRKREKQWTASIAPELWDPPKEQLSEPAKAEGKGGWPELPAAEMARLFRLDPEGRAARRSDRKRLLFWAMKQARSLDEQALARLHELTGFAPAWLAGVAARLKEQLSRREARLSLLIDRRNRAFSCLRLLEQEIGSEPDPERRGRLSRSLARARRTLHLSQRRIARIPLRPSNREIAEALGLPKGTVDTSLYWLKSRLAASGRTAPEAA